LFDKFSSLNKTQKTIFSFFFIALLVNVSLRWVGKTESLLEVVSFYIFIICAVAYFFVPVKGDISKSNR
jgi:Kef-type K+ transport system membrane component KefB